MQTRLSKNQRKILKAVGIGSIVLASFIAPNLLTLLKPRTNSQKYNHKRSFKRLINNKIIYLFGDKVRLTKKGEELLKLIQIEDMPINKENDWNGVWHLVCYDIPEKRKKERDFFRNKLVKSGFMVIQDSLWVFPYNCKEEIAVISQELGIASYVAYLNTDYLPNQKKLLRFFRLS